MWLQMAESGGWESVVGVLCRLGGSVVRCLLLMSKSSQIRVVAARRRLTGSFGIVRRSQLGGKCWSGECGVDAWC